MNIIENLKKWREQVITQGIGLVTNPLEKVYNKTFMDTVIADIDKFIIELNKLEYDKSPKDALLKFELDCRMSLQEVGESRKYVFDVDMIDDDTAKSKAEINAHYNAYLKVINLSYDESLGYTIKKITNNE